MIYIPKPFLPLPMEYPIYLPKPYLPQPVEYGIYLPKPYLPEAPPDDLSPGSAGPAAPWSAAYPAPLAVPPPAAAYPAPDGGG